MSARGSATLFPATLEKLARPHDVRGLSLNGLHMVMAMRLCALFEQAGRDPVPDLARRFGLHVLAVIDASAMAGTFGALAFGLQHYRPGLPWAGALANRVASAGHGKMLEQGVAPEHWLGALLRNPALTLPERHLGLTVATELEDAMERLDAAADALAATPLGQMDAAALQRWADGQIVDLHVADLLNNQLPSHFDYTSWYDLLVFRRLAAGQGTERMFLDEERGTASSASQALAAIDTSPVGFAVFDRVLLTVHPADCSVRDFFQTRLSQLGQGGPGSPVAGQGGASPLNDVKRPAHDDEEAHLGVDPYLIEEHHLAGLAHGHRTEGRGPSRLPPSPADLMLRIVNHMVDSYLDLRRLLDMAVFELQQQVNAMTATADAASTGATRAMVMRAVVLRVVRRIVLRMRSLFRPPPR